MGRRLIYVSSCLLAALIAGWQGYRTESESMQPPGTTRPRLESRVKRIFIPKPGSITELDRLRSRAGRTAASPGETAACWQIIRLFSLDEVKNCLAELPPAPTPYDSNPIAGMLFLRWAQIDPQGALAEAVKSPGNRPLISSVLSTWINQDREGALRWIRNLPPGSPAGSLGAQLAGSLFAWENPQTALEKAAALSPEAVTGAVFALGSRAVAAGGSPLSLLAPNPADAPLDEMNRSMTMWPVITEWCQRDPAAAFAAASEPDSKEQSTIFNDLSKTQPAMMLDWLEQHPEKKDSYGFLSRAAFASFAAIAPEDAATWAVSNDAPELLAGSLHQSAAAEMHNSYGITGKASTFAAMRTQFQAWQQMQPEDAGAWFDQLPSGLQKKLTPAPSAHATH